MNSSFFCICNLSDHASMNQKWNTLRCLPIKVDKPIEPRPQKVSSCASRCSYQPPEVLSPLKKTHIHEQLMQLKHIESQLHGRQRPAHHNYIPYAGSKVGQHSTVWNQHDLSNNVSNQFGAQWMTNGVEEERPLQWNSQMPCYRTEVWKWNDHPYMLDVGIGVKRKLTNVPQSVSTNQDMFLNSTRRKMNIV